MYSKGPFFKEEVFFLGKAGFLPWSLPEPEELV